MKTTAAAIPAITPMRAIHSAASVRPPSGAAASRARSASTHAAIEHGSVRTNSVPSETSSSDRPPMPSTSAQTVWALGAGRGTGRGAGSNCGRAGSLPGATGGSQPAKRSSPIAHSVAARRRRARPPPPLLAGVELGVDPVHHRAQLLALALDLVVGAFLAHALEVLLPGAVLGDPFARERARLDLAQHVAHRLAGRLGDDPLAAGQVAVLRR